MDAETNALQDAIRNLHGCDSTWVESVPVRETFKGRVVWEGAVEVIDLHGHDSATRCYAWLHPVGDSGRRKLYAVLHVPPVDSPIKAVRASIVRDFKKANPN
ncbi:MAG: hypothetical protein FJ087_17365 [Deltaproteobacteria bacterium]|nr:hypothetical protein [Deltaproteobacteria bacterium]